MDAIYVFISRQVVVVCGTNEEVKSSLEKESWASNVHKHVKVREGGGHFVEQDYRVYTVRIWFGFVP